MQQHKRHSTAHRASPKNLRVFRGIRSLPSPIAGFLSAFRVESARNYSGEVRAEIERQIQEAGGVQWQQLV